jgi:hemoglobin-like flavoprotein
MTTEQIELLDASWTRVAPHATAFADAFYARLFELEPRLEDLFVITAMESQGQKLVAMLDQLVKAARDPDRFRQLLSDSGRRHMGYGVVPGDYRTVGEAMLWALDRTPAGPMSTEEREVWAESYTRMAALMQKG